MGISLGGGKSSGSSQATLTPEQQRLLGAQTDFLTGTAFPAYQKTVGMAGNTYNQVNPAAITAAQTAMDVSGRAGALQEQSGSNAYGQGLTGQSGLAGYQAGMGQNLFGGGASQLAQLFNPQYKQEQIDAALQAGRESARESQAGQNAMYGGAGGLGSSRMALADKNLSSLNAQRQATAAAGASANVEAQRQNAANALMGAGANALGQAGGLFGSLTGAGQAGLSGAQQSAASRIGYAGTPQDVLSKYASIIYGTPQQSTTPNFAGTQGQTGSSKGFGMGGSLGK
jgi:hypothetical protein